jgi:hypothetical protein
MQESDEHFKPLRLFDLARHSRFEITEEERKHLGQCEECQSVLEVFTRQFTKPSIDQPKDAA